MAYDITAALDLLDLAVGRATEIVEPELLTPHAQAAKDIRARIGFLGRSVVVALVGGTGSGKSSLLNALAGEEIAATGVVRPTTERPLAWIPANAEPGLIRLLDDLAIGDRIGHDSFGDIAILDLPDTDSVVRSHREVVEYLLPRVDAVIWVLDPEKYNDRLLHRDLLQPLSRYSKQFIFVLNQIDRLSPAEENQVVDDLRRTLALDGIENAQLLATAADPDEGPPIGIARLSRDLHGRLEAKQVVMTKLIADLREARDGIARSTGVGVGAGTSYDDRWDATANRVAGILVDPVLADDASAREAGRQAALGSGGGPIAALARWYRSTRFARAAGGTRPEDDVRLDASAQLTQAASSVNELVADLSFEIGGSFGRALRGEVVPEAVEQEIGRIVEAASREVGEFRIGAPRLWWRTIGFLQWFLAGAVLAGVIWLWADPESLRPGGDVRPFLLAAGSLVLGMLLRAAVVRAGHRAGRRALRRHVDALRAAVRSRLDRGVGSSIRTRMRTRAEVAGALTELGIITAALEENL